MKVTWIVNKNLKQNERKTNEKHRIIITRPRHISDVYKLKKG